MAHISSIETVRRDEQSNPPVAPYRAFEICKQHQSVARSHSTWNILSSIWLDQCSIKLVHTTKACLWLNHIRRIKLAATRANPGCLLSPLANRRPRCPMPGLWTRKHFGRIGNQKQFNLTGTKQAFCESFTEWNHHGHKRAEREASTGRQ